MTVINSNQTINVTKKIKKPKCQRLSLGQIDVPFPISDQLNAVIASYKERKITGKPPNCFLLYRKALVREFNNHGYYLPAKEISPIASEKWKNKPDIVKQEYREISEDIAKILQDKETPRILTPANFSSQNSVRTKKDFRRASKGIEDVIQFTDFSGVSEPTTPMNQCFPENDHFQFDASESDTTGVSKPTTPINQHFHENNHFEFEASEFDMSGVSEPTTPMNQCFHDNDHLKFDASDVDSININVNKFNQSVSISGTSQNTIIPTITNITTSLGPIENQNSNEPNVSEIFDPRQYPFSYEEDIYESTNLTFQNSYNVFPPSDLLLNLMDHESKSLSDL
ncbi:6622_t:CDS:2 [Ambispora leptoticha]|uniref:6622_t:CDS:1 n=1 Tax=Ambispora leptoticha TaxID=144679 RepID=A0A9N9AQS6_9GLOM|nr:6622_t:CDS:2 [Ambispora leptoticha]